MSAFSFETQETGARHGRFLGRVAGIDAEAEITFTRRGEGLISADHTGAPDALRGTGIAAALVAHMVAEARGQGLRIIPLCPYVRKQYARHPEWSDVFVTEPGAVPVLPD